MKQILRGSDLGKALVEAGMVPENCSKIIIEIDPAKPVILHYCVYGEEDLLRVVIAEVNKARVEDDLPK